MGTWGGKREGDQGKVPPIAKQIPVIDSSRRPSLPLDHSCSIRLQRLHNGLLTVVSPGALASRPSSSFPGQSTLETISVRHGPSGLGRTAQAAQGLSKCYRTLARLDSLWYSPRTRLLLLFGVPGQPPFWKPSVKFQSQGS